MTIASTTQPSPATAAPLRRRPGRLATPGALRGAFRAMVPPAFLALLTGVFCWKLVAGGLVVIGYDTLTYMYAYRYYAAQALSAGRIPLWNPHIFFGVPFLANLQSAVFYPLHALFLAMPATDAMNWSVVLHLFLCAYFAYLAARVVAGADRLSGVVGGAVYGLSGFVGAQVGHLNQLNAAAWMPLALATLHLALTRRSLRWVAATAAVLGVQLLAGHAQESFMTVVVLASYAAFWVLREVLHAARSPRARAAPDSLANGQLATVPRRPSRRQRAAAAGRALMLATLWATLALGLGGVLAAGLAAVQLVPSAELTGYSIRSGGMGYWEATSFSLPPRELFIGLLPTFGMAAPTSNEFLGWTGVAALGLIVFALLFRARRPVVLFFAVLLAVSLLLALGAHAPLYAWAFKVPGVRLFRVPARWLMLYTLAASMLASVGLTFIRQLGTSGWHATGIQNGTSDAADVIQAPAGPWRRLFAASRLLAGVLVLSLAAVWLWPTQALWQSGPPPALVGAWLGLGGGVVALSFWSLATAPAKLPSALFALAVFVELFFASRSLEYNNPNPPRVYTQQLPVHGAVAAAETPADRLLTVARTGYHPSNAAQVVAGYESILGPNGVLASLINSKWKEVLSPNLTMVYGGDTPDGYDGGVLPLRRYVDFKQLVVPPGQNIPDALLRDQLRGTPSLQQLRPLGASLLLTDTIGDVTTDGVYYDLASPLVVAPGQRVRLDHLGIGASTSPAGPVRAVGVISSLEGGLSVAQGTAVARISLLAGSGTAPASGRGTPAAGAAALANGEPTQASGGASVSLLAGRHTAEGAYSGEAHHAQPAPLGAPTNGANGAATYLALLDVPSTPSAGAVVVENLQPAGGARLRILGITLIGDGDRQWPVTLAGEGTLQLLHHSDVKLYRDPGALPRAYVASRATIAADEPSAIAEMSQVGHDPTDTVMLERAVVAPAPAGRLRRALAGLEEVAFGALGIERSAIPGAVTSDAEASRLQAVGRGAGGAGSSAPAGVEWLADEPERVTLRVTAPAGGFLVLRDTEFPGWAATVDGRPVPLLRADVLFRAVELAAGDSAPHEVVFTYRSVPFERGGTVSLLALVVLAAMAWLPASVYHRALPPLRPFQRRAR